jgi:penicillin-binding protein 1A
MTMATEGKIEATAPAQPDRRPAAPRRRLVVWAKRIAGAIALLILAAALAVGLLVRHYEADLPSIAELKAYNPPQVTRVLARDGTMLGELFTERRTLVPIEAIPNRVKLAVLAAEDAAFYEHAGLNYLGMLRAMAKNVTSAHARQGGSTITQQVVKNVLLTPERTFSRKMREAILARRIEAELSKDEILDLYLNQIYFGHGRYGVEEAARYYFGKGVKDVSLSEAALLAGIIKGPSVFSPRVDMTKAISRRDYVLGQMAQKGFASAELVAAAKKETITLATEPEARPELAPEVVDEVKRTLRALVGPAADRGGYTVTTTVDPALEEAARAALRKTADDYAKRHKLLAPLVKAKKEPAPFEGTPTGHHSYLGVVVGADDAKNTLDVRVGTLTGTLDVAEAARYNPPGLRAPEFAQVGKTLRVSFATAPKAEAEGNEKPAATSKPKLRLELGPEGAIVAVDVRTREILALVGSYEGVRAGLDRTTSHRQPGSTFKPFVYSYGIHARTLTAATLVETNPANLPEHCRPRNYEEVEGQSIKLLRNALAQSVNAAAAWSLVKVGPSNVVAWARALGIGADTKLGADCSLALGAYEVTPREMAGAYATFAAGGVYEEPFLIAKIVGPNGVAVPLPARAPSRRVLEENEAYVVTSLLTSVVKDGTGKRAKALGRPIAGKTGTSNQAKDAWFVGYSTDIACAVWTGYDDPLPMGAGEAGASVALPAFVDFMREAHKKRPVADFPVPAGLVRAMIDPATGLKAYPDEKEAVEEIFLAGTEPTETASPDAGAGDAGAPASDAGGRAEPPGGDADGGGEAPPF